MSPELQHIWVTLQHMLTSVLVWKSRALRFLLQVLFQQMAMSCFNYLDDNSPVGLACHAIFEGTLTMVKGK
jgi:hypothetical protein